MRPRQINREDMLELTRRMTVKRNCFCRIAGGYMDEEGYVEGSFNRNFLQLETKLQEKNIALAKTVPFAETNKELVGIRFDKEEMSSECYQAFSALRKCQLKNDALLESIYEMIGKKYRSQTPYAIYVFSGTYDIPLKGTDKESQWESEEVYEFVICVITDLEDDYETGDVRMGFLFPAFADRSTDVEGMNVYGRTKEERDFIKRLFQKV